MTLSRTFSYPACVVAVFLITISISFTLRVPSSSSFDSSMAVGSRRTRSSSSSSTTRHYLWRLDHSYIPWSVLEQSTDRWEYHLLEQSDLDRAAALSAECFFNPRVVFNTSGMSEAEIGIVNFIKNTYTNFELSDSRFSNYVGFRTRGGARLRNPTVGLTSDSLIIAATPKNSDKIIAGLVEICLEKPRGSLAPPIRLPWTHPNVETDEPYLCNLCVADAYRRRGLAKLLCEVGEQLVANQWNKDIMYLHVEKNNTAARQLYESVLRYDMTPGLDPFEARKQGMENILYYKKKLVKIMRE
jgi:ribosomal protein S18 acetylase RimI-like enzyme